MVAVVAVSVMFGTCHGLVVVVAAVAVVDVDTWVVSVTSGVHSCVPAVSMPVIVAPASPLPCPALLLATFLLALTGRGDALYPSSTSSAQVRIVSSTRSSCLVKKWSAPVMITLSALRTCWLSASSFPTSPCSSCVPWTKRIGRS